MTDLSFRGGKRIAISYDKLRQSVKEGTMDLCTDDSLSPKFGSEGMDCVMTEGMNKCALGGRRCHCCAGGGGPGAAIRGAVGGAAGMRCTDHLR